MSRKYTSGKFSEKINKLPHKNQVSSEESKAFSAKPLIPSVSETPNVRKENIDTIFKKDTHEYRIKKYFKMDIKDSSDSTKAKVEEPPAKRKYKRVLRGFGRVAAISGVMTLILVVIDFFTTIYLNGIFWEILFGALGLTIFLSCAILLVLLFIYPFLKQTKKFKGDAAEEKRGFKKVKWEYIYLLLLQLICLPIAAVAPIALIPAIFMALISFIYYNKERKITKESDFFNYKRTGVFVVLVGVILMLSFVFAFGGIF